MKKAFTKGERVTLIRSWDDKGTVYIHQAIVHSCGAKKLILTDEATGEELGRNFLPVVATLGQLGTYSRIEKDALQAVGVYAARAYIAREQQSLVSRCYDWRGKDSNGFGSARHGNWLAEVLAPHLDDYHAPEVEIH